MQSSLVLQNLLSPPVLFFFLGVLAVLFKSDLDIPSPLPKLFSLYLLMAIGFKGGIELAYSGLGSEVLLTIGAAIFMALAVPLLCFYVLRLKLDAANAAAVAASYGSISAVTFITAESFLNVLQLDFDGFMVAALALMESPAIVVGVILAKLYSDKGGDSQTLYWREVLREAFLNGSVFLLIGSLVIGALVGSFNAAGVEKMVPFTEKLFYGALCFFLLDMGLVAAQRLQDLRQVGSFLIGFAVLAPTDAQRIARLLGELGDSPYRGGRFISAMALADPQGQTRLEGRGICHGTILSQPRGQGGGYDPIFWVREAGCTYAEMTPHLKARLGSRGKAAREMAPGLRQLLGLD